jgi:hypothetical protein
MACVTACVTACATTPPAPGGPAAPFGLERPDAPREDDLTDALAPESARLAGHSVEGRPIRYSVHEAAADRARGVAGETVLLAATIHGDEDAGTPLLQRLAGFLAADPDRAAGTRVVIVPVLNPDGLVAHRRQNARGVDLNRNYPAANRREHATSGDTALSEPESVALHQLIERYRPQRVVSIHGWVGVVDWDGPARDLAQAFGASCGLPVKQIGSRPGSLGSFVGVDRGTPILTLELPDSARDMSPDELWDTYGPALLDFICWTPTHSS